ncbi:MAG: DUF4087 domain-containing protein [Acetobacteraceae bacterium]|nr:MAG: DUF4087 domain-containing protein [Acetobacteraceae bacterium]
MRFPLIVIVAVVAALPAHAETRCGWDHHPTPGWHYLQDADGEWWFSESATPPAIGHVSVPGFDLAYDPAFDGRRRLDYSGKVTDGSYGFSCACAEGDFRDDTVLSLARLWEIPMARCGADPKLPKPQLYEQDN